MNNFEKKKTGIPSQCQIDWTQIRSDVYLPDLGPICLQSYEQMTLIGNELILSNSINVMEILPNELNFKD